MRYLLDTHAILWYVRADPRLPMSLRQTMDSEECFYSIASLWEIAIKQSLGKLQIELSVPGMEAQCHLRDIRILPIRSNAIERIKTLPNLHRDPFDRLLIAQALEEGLVMVTRDGIIPQYPVQSVW